jgi:hypothetical protein
MGKGLLLVTVLSAASGGKVEVFRDGEPDDQAMRDVSLAFRRTRLGPNVITRGVHKIEFKIVNGEVIGLPSHLTDVNGLVLQLSRIT